MPRPVASSPPVPEEAEGWATRGWVLSSGVFLVIIVVEEVGSLVGVGLSIRAYETANATMVAVFENTLLVFATLWAIVPWREVPAPLEGLGVALVTAAGLLIAGASRARYRRARTPDPLALGPCQAALGLALRRL